jgi:nicotinamidase-related amidase
MVVLLVDVISDFAFPDGERLLPRALRAAQKLVALKARAERAGVPCIYANDHYGRWRSDFRSQVQRCTRASSAGSEIAQLLKPSSRDYFVLKPKHSAFYQTCLSLLLDHLGARTLVIGGFSTDSCVTFTATDAYLRGYSLIIPSDGTAACDAASHRAALVQMSRTLHARTPSCSGVNLQAREREAAR